MSKLVAVMGSVLLAASIASTPALAKKRHKVARAEPQMMMPMPLIGGAPMREGRTCYAYRSMDWGARYEVACPKK